MSNLKIFAETIEESALEQIKKLSEHPAFKNSKIRIMPDVHSGEGCTIGTTATIEGRVIPNVVGVDIACGMLAAKIRTDNPDLERLDEVIHETVPSGQNIRDNTLFRYSKLNELACKNNVNIARAELSLGTLGGGNHFIELDKGKNGYWLVIHTGSRHLGLEVAKYYQEEAYKRISKVPEGIIESVIKEHKAAGTQNEIPEALKDIKKKYAYKGEKSLAYCEGELFYDYLHDVDIIHDFADFNRKCILRLITKGMGWTFDESFSTLHNYIDLSRMIIRKGAVSSEKNEKLIIPMNMRDGSLICIGKGNEDWNYSAPHGAGRIMSRAKAFDTLDISEYEEQMKNVFTTSVCKETIDESPMVYKSMDEIIRCIEPTCEVIDIIKPVYNFKARN